MGHLFSFNLSHRRQDLLGVCQQFLVFLPPLSSPSPGHPPPIRDILSWSNKRCQLAPGEPVPYHNGGGLPSHPLCGPEHPCVQASANVAQRGVQCRLGVHLRLHTSHKLLAVCASGEHSSSDFTFLAMERVLPNCRLLDCIRCSQSDTQVVQKLSTPVLCQM